MKRFIILFLLCIGTIGVYSQNSLEGVILDKQGKPVAKLSMRLKGELKDIRTNSKGSFKIKRIYEGDTLMIFPFENMVAYLPLHLVPAMTIHMGDNGLRMECDQMSLTCIYQKYIPEEYDPNILTRAQIRRFEASDLVEALRGRIAGLVIDEDDNGPIARIRGVSMSEKTEPLFVIDGVKYFSLCDANNTVNIDAVEQIEVVKDGAAYGMDGANGTILITTRR